MDYLRQLKRWNSDRQDFQGLAFVSERYDFEHVVPNFTSVTKILHNGNALAHLKENMVLFNFQKVTLHLDTPTRTVYLIDDLF